MLNCLIGRFGADKLNTLTKYPSIATYHEIGAKGALLPTLTGGAGFPEREPCFVTEKIDGTNVRIIMAAGDYIIGSREELFHAKGDRFYNPAMGLVQTVRPVAESIVCQESPKDCFLVYYGELYGGRVGAGAKQYTRQDATEFRLFDLAVFTADEAVRLLDQPIETIAGWRERDFGRFLPYHVFQAWCEAAALPCAPLLATVEGKEIPIDRAATVEWMRQFSGTKVGLDFSGYAEGVVVRTVNRSMIRKLRFEDYERTRRKGGF